jgi:hypothetical protein
MANHLTHTKFVIGKSQTFRIRYSKVSDLYHVKTEGGRLVKSFKKLDSAINYAKKH